MPTILVVDDDDRNLHLAQAALEQAGHIVLTAEDGATAIEAALEHVPDLILMDVQMPGLDGRGALAGLRADPRTAAIRVVAFTAMAMKDDREELLAQGFDGYLSKPIRYRELLAEVERLLQGGPAM